MRSRFAITLLAPLGGVFLLLWTVPLFPAPAPPPDLKEKVKALVEQLAGKDTAKQQAAAAALIKLGPDVLPLLPPVSDKPDEGLNKVLAPVRKALREQRVQRDLTPLPITIESDDMPLSKALESIAKRTGITVEDKRDMGDDPHYKLRIKNMTFWQALDSLAQEADARVNFYEGDGKLALVKRPENYQDPPVSYDRLFRTAVKRITAVRNLEGEQSQYMATLEVAWESRFHPFMLEVKPGDLTFRDDNNRVLTLEQGESNKQAVSHRNAVTFDVALPSLERKAAKLGLFKGSLTMVGPTHMDTFSFESTLAEMDKDPKARQLTRDGVTVKVGQLDLAKDHWTLTMELEYPGEGPQFESFESWLVFNEIYLKKKESLVEQTFSTNSYVIESSSGNKAVVSYHFTDEPRKKFIRGKPEDWTVVYKTPGMILNVPVNFEFKDLPLP